MEPIDPKVPVNQQKSLKSKKVSEKHKTVRENAVPTETSVTQSSEKDRISLLEDTLTKLSVTQSSENDRISLLEDILIKLSISVTETQAAVNRVVTTVERDMMDKLRNMNSNMNKYGDMKEHIKNLELKNKRMVEFELENGQLKLENGKLKSDIIQCEASMKELQNKLDNAGETACAEKYIIDIQRLNDRLDYKDKIIESLREESSELNDEIVNLKSKMTKLVEVPCAALGSVDSVIIDELSTRANNESPRKPEGVNITFFHDSIAKHIDIQKLVNSFKVDKAEKVATYTLNELREKAESCDPAHTVITHVGVNDILKAECDVEELVREMRDIIEIFLTKSQKVILSLVAPTKAGAESWKISRFNRDIQEGLRGKENVIFCNNDNFEYRGKIIDRLFDRDKRHLSQQGSARLAANIISCLNLEKKDSLTENQNQRYKHTGKEFQGQQRYRNGRVRGRGRGRGGGRNPQTHNQNLSGPNLSNNQFLQALRTAILGSGTGE